MLAMCIAASGFIPASSVVAVDWSLPADVQPAVKKALRDRERPWADKCIGLTTATVPRNCVYGNPSGKFTLALVGDSHISHLFPAFERIARDRGWRLVVMLKISCPLIDVPLRNVLLKKPYTECATWNENVIARLAKSPPDLTVVGFSHWIYPIKVADRKVAAKAAGVARMLQRLPGKTILMADTLISAVDVPKCLAANRSDVRRCATPRKRAFTGHGAIEGRAAKQAGVPLIDITNAICSGDPCPAIVDKMIVYRDTHHMTATFTASLWPALAKALDEAR